MGSRQELVYMTFLAKAVAAGGVDDEVITLWVDGLKQAGHLQLHDLVKDKGCDLGAMAQVMLESDDAEYREGGRRLQEALT